jgi:molybdopterin-guanine dinucleotide biosynthesis protein A
MLAALRKRPGIAWVLVACDLPLIDTEAVAWLVAQRARGRRVILPSVGGRVHPLFALYEPSALELLEELAENHQLAPTRLVGRPGVVILEPPVALHRCWTNVNTPEELAQLWETF